MKISLRVVGISAGIIALLVFFILVSIKMKDLSEESERSTRPQMAIDQRANEEATKEAVREGMTTAQVRQGWGEPRRILRGQSETGDVEWWYYGRSRNESMVLFFRNGTLQSVLPPPIHGEMWPHPGCLVLTVEPHHLPCGNQKRF